MHPPQAHFLLSSLIDSEAVITLLFPSMAAPRNPELSYVDIEEENHSDKKQCQELQKSDKDYTQRGQWLRAAVLGANDGLVSVASLMMGIGAVKEDVKAMLLVGFAGMVAGACSMAIGEFVSVYTQLDIERAQLKRAKLARMRSNVESNQIEAEKEQLPNPFQAALASAIAFSVGAIVPLLAAGFISEHKIRLAVVVAVASLTLLVFGCVGAVIGRTHVGKSCVRVLAGGLVAMAITFGLTKWIGSQGLGM